MLATSRNLYGNMTAVGRWQFQKFDWLQFNMTKNSFHFSFISNFSTEENSSLVGTIIIREKEDKSQIEWAIG